MNTNLTRCHKSKQIVAQALCFVLLCFNAGCQQPANKEIRNGIPAGNHTEKYLPLLQGRAVGVLTNASGMIGTANLVDTLLSIGVNVKKVFVPEHGFRGDVDAGEKVDNSIDSKTGIPVISLYGKNKKPDSTQLTGIDIVLYDIQDLGTRFYTYISTMSYAMEACAEQGKKMIVLDRPNPNGFYIDGPVLKPEFRSFLGMHPVPVVYGMTCGEYARMVNGEGWLKDSVVCDLTVIPMEKYDRNKTYTLSVRPSPNIPNSRSVLLYPALGLFEGTIMSLGRGTDHPFQVIGHPDYPDTSFYFVPEANDVNRKPRYEGEKCFGIDLRKTKKEIELPQQLRIELLIRAYNKFDDAAFFEKTFDAHAGSNHLREQLINHADEAEIRKSWEKDLEHFKTVRKKYLLYPDVN